jgi:hypothetical protein
MEIDNNKICNGKLCNGKIKPLTEFGTIKGKPRCICKDCKNYESKLFREKYKEKIKTYSTKYRENNREKEKLRYKKYRNNNKESIKDKLKKFRDKHKDRLHDQIQDKLQIPDKYIEYLIVQLRAKDKKANRECNIDFEYIKDLIDKQNNRCIYSGVELIWKNKAGIYQGTIDRIDSKEGHIKGNCQLTTSYINYFKTDLSDSDFKKLISLIWKSYNKIHKKENIIEYEKLSTECKKKISCIFKDIKKREYDRLYKIQLNLLINSGMNDDEAEIKVKKDINIKDINIDIDKKYLDELRKKQKDICCLSNMKLTWKPNCLNTASIDRIDSSKGYSKDNIQITSWYVNCMKKNLSDDIAKQILDDIMNYNQ